VLAELEAVLAEHDALERCVSVEPRRREDQDADLRLLFADRAWLRSPAGEELIADLRASAAVAGAVRHRSAIALRLEDAHLAELERRLAAGEPAGMDASDLLDGRAFVVGFVGPNTNKALHAGHLRNVVLGQALACAMDRAGAAVTRHSLVGDIGRRVCEAMGGYLSARDGDTPQTLGIAGDRFVELCSREFPREDAQADAASAAGDPNAEEGEVQGDLADAIMQAWLAGAASERALWSRMREWVLAGHSQTLARLGVCMDRHDYESDGIARALELIAHGERCGLFEREAGGGVVYRTGRPEYTTMVLLRGDGAPTEYARLLGVYHLMSEELLRDAVYIEVVGIEWQPVMAVQAELLTRLLQRPSDERYEWAFHGSVTVGGQKMGSSTGQVLWIDDLLDQVAAGPGVSALYEQAQGAVEREQLADIVIRGTLLCSPTTQPLAFVFEHLLEGGSGPGWTIAHAWCHALRSREPAGEAPAPRTALVQSQLYRRSLQRTVKRRDAAHLATYLLGLSEACLAAPMPGPAAAPMLRCVLESLGFLTEAANRKQSTTHTLTGWKDDPKLSNSNAHAPVAQVVKDPHKALVRAEC